MSDAPDVLLPLTRQLQLAIGRESAYLIEEWIGSIILPLDPTVGCHLAGPCDVIALASTPHHQLLKTKIRISSTEYPSHPHPKLSLDRLRDDIIRSARTECGALLKCNGHACANAKNSRVFRCSCSFLYQPRGKHAKTESDHLPPVKDTTNLRVDSLHNNRKNTRGSLGKKMSRRTDTLLRLQKADDRCPFRLTVEMDQDGFFIRADKGCPHHKFHQQLDPKTQMSFPTRLLSLEVTKLLGNIGTSNTSPGVARAIHQTRTGDVLTTAQMAFVINRAIANDYAKPGSSDQPSSSVDKMIACVTRKKGKYCMLSQHSRASSHVSELKTAARNPLTEDGDSEEEDIDADGNGDTNTIGIINETTADRLDGSVDYVHQSVQKMTRRELKEANEYAVGNRTSMCLVEDQILMIAFAFVMPEELRMFDTFPQVMHIDCTADTNNEQRPLLTVSGRDSSNKMFTVLRAFLPNERAWVFRWLFQNVFPILFGQRLLSNLRVIISQMDAAIIAFFPQAIRRRCIWHIVDRGFDHRVSKTKGGDKAICDAVFTDLRGTLRTWMFTWAQPGYCYTELELAVSKNLMIKYLQSQPVLAVLGDRVAQQIMHLLRNHVEPHQDLFAFCKHKNYLNFDTNSNCAHEGTNKGLKYATASVLPTHTLHKSTKILTDNAKMKSVDKQMLGSRKSRGTKTWGKSPAANFVTDVGESLLSQQVAMSLPELYGWFQPQVNVWLLGLISPKECNGVIPRFRRIWIVTLHPLTGCLSCSCQYFTRVGLPCRHVLFVCRMVLGEEYCGPTHLEVSCFWWKDAVVYGLSTAPKHMQSRKLFQQLRLNDTQGPSVPSGWKPDNATYQQFGVADETLLEKYKSQASLPVCANYSRADVATALAHSKGGGAVVGSKGISHGPACMSQQTLTYGSDGAGSDNFGDFDDFDDNTSIAFQDNTKEEWHGKERAPYQELMPLMKEIIGIHDGLPRKRMDATKVELNEILFRLKTEVALKLGRTPTNKDTYVSSSQVTNKKRKTHGTNYN
jgi:hypothetical protein